MARATTWEPERMAKLDELFENIVLSKAIWPTYDFVIRVAGASFISNRRMRGRRPTIGKFQVETTERTECGRQKVWSKER